MLQRHFTVTSLELTTLNIEIHFKTPSTTSPVRRSPATQTGHVQTQVAGLARAHRIIEACKYLSTYTNTHIIIIWFDNISSTQAISPLSTRSRTSGDCYDTLNALGYTNTLEILWIAAHIGLWGNEKADELAKTGTTNESTLKCPILQSYPKRLIDDKATKLNQETW